jgi:hypothetical protein
LDGALGGRAAYSGAAPTGETAVLTTVGAGPTTGFTTAGGWTVAVGTGVTDGWGHACGIGDNRNG